MNITTEQAYEGWTCMGCRERITPYPAQVNHDECATCYRTRVGNTPDEECEECHAEPDDGHADWCPHATPEQHARQAAADEECHTCTPDETGCCSLCGVAAVDCPTCGRTSFHADDCPEIH